MLGVMRRRLFPLWLRRGLEAGALAALLACGTLLAFELGRPAPRLALPSGVDGSLIVISALLALGVLAVGVPVVVAATRSEAVLGAIAGFLVGADLLMLVSLIFPQSVAVGSLGVSLPLGLLAAILAIPVALAGIVFGPLLEPLGFGRSAGLRTLFASCVAATAVALAAPFVVW